MKVLLVNPPWRQGEGRYGVRAGSRWPFTLETDDPRRMPYLPFPFFLAYAAALLEARSRADVTALDAIAEGLTEAEYAARLADIAPDVIVAECAQASFGQDLRHARAAKAALPGVRYVLAGPQASVGPKALLAAHPEIDCCLVGEYEWTLLEYVNALSGPHFDPARIAGLAWRDALGIPRQNPRRPLGDLAELPWPAYGHFPMLRYHDYFGGIPAPMVNMVGSRGCPFHCSFCLWPELLYGGRRYRGRDPRDVADEMAFLVDTYGFKSVYFDDDTFNIGQSRIIALAEEIRQRDRDACLAVMARADTMDEAMLDALIAAGLRAVKYGLESASQDILDRCGKGLDVNKAVRMIRHTMDRGVKVHLTFTVGLPGETRETIEDSLRLALALDADSIQISLATPFPGTAFHADVAGRGHLAASAAADFDGSRRAVVRTETLTTEEVEAGFKRFQETWAAHRAKRGARP